MLYAYNFYAIVKCLSDISSYNKEKLRVLDSTKVYI